MEGKYSTNWATSGYLKPTYKRPYFYINTAKNGGKISTLIEEQSLLDPCGLTTSDCGIPEWKNDLYKVLNPCGTSDENCQVGKIMEIRCGKNKGFYPDVAYVDYLKLPKEDVLIIGEKNKEIIPNNILLFISTICVFKSFLQFFAQFLLKV